MIILVAKWLLSYRVAHLLWDHLRHLLRLQRHHVRARSFNMVPLLLVAYKHHDCRSNVPWFCHPFLQPHTIHQVRHLYCSNSLVHLSIYMYWVNTLLLNLDGTSFHHQVRMLRDYHHHLRTLCRRRIFLAGVGEVLWVEGFPGDLLFATENICLINPLKKIIMDTEDDYVSEVAEYR